VNRHLLRDRLGAGLPWRTHCDRRWTISTARSAIWRASGDCLAYVKDQFGFKRSWCGDRRICGHRDRGGGLFAWPLGMIRRARACAGNDCTSGPSPPFKLPTPADDLRESPLELHHPIAAGKRPGDQSRATPGYRRRPKRDLRIPGAGRPPQSWRALLEPVADRVRGSVGYYCAGMRTRPLSRCAGSAAGGAAESMMGAPS